MDNTLFNNAIKFNDYAKRNILFVSQDRIAFSSISEEDDLLVIAEAIQFARKSVSRKKSLEDFYYTAAIGYPFRTKPFMSTRYSDGSYPVWYASTTVETSIYETAHHSIRFLLSEAGVSAEEKIVKKRSIFDVFCNAFLVDLTKKVSEYPDIIADNYEFTHQIGKEACQGGLPGILSPSARYTDGINISIFNQAVLQDPKLLHQLKYTIFPKKGLIKITGLKKPIEINF